MRDDPLGLEIAGVEFSFLNAAISGGTRIDLLPRRACLVEALRLRRVLLSSRTFDCLPYVFHCSSPPSA
jgi:hypothetical protein